MRAPTRRPPRTATFFAPRRRQGHRWRLAVTVLAAMGLGAAVTLAVTSYLGPDARPDQRPPVASAPAALPALVQPSPVPGGDLTWADFHGVLLPTSATAGPARDDGLLQTGFADTDFGAALAAAHITLRASSTPGPGVFHAALQRQVIGEHQPALAVRTGQAYTQRRIELGVPDGEPLEGGAPAALVGYTTRELPGGNRHVQLVQRAVDASGEQRIFSVDVVMAWAEEDWRLIAPQDGQWQNAVSELPAVPAGTTHFEGAR